MKAKSHLTVKPLNIKHTSVGNIILDYWDVVVALPIGAVQLHLYSGLNTWLQWIGQKQLQD